GNPAKEGEALFYRAVPGELDGGAGCNWKRLRIMRRPVRSPRSTGARRRDVEMLAYAEKIVNDARSYPKLTSPGCAMPASRPEHRRYRALRRPPLLHREVFRR